MDGSYLSDVESSGEEDGNWTELTGTDDGEEEFQDTERRLKDEDAHKATTTIGPDEGTLREDDLEICSVSRPCIPFPLNRHKGCEEGTLKRMILMHYTRQATPSHAIILDELMNHLPLYGIAMKIQHNRSEANKGIPCFVCDQEISQDKFWILQNDIKYTIIFKSKVESHRTRCPEYQELQCSRCLNCFHRSSNCSLSMNDDSYVRCIVGERNWLCPLCVPEFVPRIKINNNTIGKNADMTVQSKLGSWIYFLKKHDPFYMLADKVCTQVIKFCNLECLYEIG
jgi:hypothetical protein